jgi:hypothetical protein
MIANAPARVVRAGFLTLVLAVAAVSPAPAQQPSANAIALAKQIIVAKGGNSLYDPIIPQIIDQAKAMLMQSNPMLTRDLNEVATKLRSELTPRGSALLDDGAKLYAARFTEQELKDVLTFYKSPLGQKIVTQEPEILLQSSANVDTWANKFSEEVIAKFRAEMKKKGHEI